MQMLIEAYIYNHFLRGISSFVYLWTSLLTDLDFFWCQEVVGSLDYEI